MWPLPTWASRRRGTRSPDAGGRTATESLNQLFDPPSARAFMFPTPDFVGRLSGDLQRDLFAFLPELLLCATIVLMLLARLVPGLSRAHMAEFALGLSVLALGSAIWFWPEAWSTEGPVPVTGGKAGFCGLIVFDKFGLFLRVFLLGFLCLSLWLSLLTGIPDRDDSADYATLL